MIQYEHMFAYRAKYYKSVLGFVALLAALVAFGCGSGGGQTTVTLQGSVQQNGEAPNADVADADQGDVAVIGDWISKLSHGNVSGAADLFALPSTAENGPVLTQIEAHTDAVAFNRSLPCGGVLIEAHTDGDETTATFRLTDRSGGDCGLGTGTRASTAFKIEGGKIVEWRRVANPGERRSPIGEPPGSTV